MGLYSGGGWGLYSGGLIFGGGGGAYIRNGLNVSNLMGLYLGVGL